MKEISENSLRVFCAVILLFCLFCQELSAQYQGGVADGQAGISLASIVGPPFYCYGGQSDGHALLAHSNTVSPEMYCTGGIADGNASLYSPGNIADPVYASGGSGDGMSWTGAYSIIGIPFYCLGGNGDGFALTDCFGLTSGSAVYCFGGNEDGFGLIAFQGLTNGIALYCYGGTEDGAGLTLSGGTLAPPNYCFGGTGDGNDFTWIPEFIMGDGKWTGYVSNNWESPGNWTNNNIPGDGASVSIPAGCLHYPILNSNFSINDPQFGDIHCSELSIKNGAVFTSSGSVRINGKLGVSGQYNHTNPSNDSFHVTEQGIVTVRPGGSVSIQP